MARLQVLKARDDHVARVLDEATQRLGHITADTARYQQLLLGQLLQALFQLLETDVSVRCREQDAGLLQKAIPTATSMYKQATHGLDVRVTINRESWLPATWCVLPPTHRAPVRTAPLSSPPPNVPWTRLHLLTAAASDASATARAASRLVHATVRSRW